MSTEGESPEKICDKANFWRVCSSFWAYFFRRHFGVGIELPYCFSSAFLHSSASLELGFWEYSGLIILFFEIFINSQSSGVKL